MDIKNFLIGLLCSALVVILLVAWSDVGAAPVAATENRYQFAAGGGEMPQRFLFDQRTCTLHVLSSSRGVMKWVELVAGPPK